MKKIWSILSTHLKEDFRVPYYISIAVVLSVGIWLNYTYRIEEYIDRYPANSIRIVYYLLLYGSAYFAGIALVVVFRERKEILRDRAFWGLTLSGLLILSFDSGFPFLSGLIFGLGINVKLFAWTYVVMSNAISILLVGIPLVIVYLASPASRSDYYGLRLKRYDFRPYLILLALMVPLLTMASFQQEFINYYPTYKTNPVAETLHVPNWMPVVVYEFFYGMDFFNLELLFRGFLVIGLTRVLGRDAIIPMVITYCFLHFGKPIGEQISSVFGGYILGVIAFYTRGIWGGVIIHMGIAWLMELLAYWQEN